MVNFLLDPIVNATTPRGIYDIPSSVFSGGMSAIDVVSLPPLSLSSFPVPTVGRSFYGSVFFPYASSVSMSMGLWGDRWYDSDLMFTGALLASRDASFSFGLPPLGFYPTYHSYMPPPLQISEFKMPPVGNFMRMSGDPAASEQPSGNDHSVAPPPPPPSGPPPAYGGGQEGEAGGSGPGNGAVSQGRRRRTPNTRGGGDPPNPPPDSDQIRQVALRASGLQSDVEAQIKQALKSQLGDGQVFSVFSLQRDDPHFIFVGSDSLARPLRKNYRTGQWSIENPIGTVKDDKLLIPESK